MECDYGDEQGPRPSDQEPHHDGSMEAIKTEPESTDDVPDVPTTQYGQNDNANDENYANIVTNDSVNGEEDSVEIPEVKMEVPEHAGNFIHTATLINYIRHYHLIRFDI